VAGPECPLWVKSGHSRTSGPCPLYPQKRTSADTAEKSAPIITLIGAYRKVTGALCANSSTQCRNQVVDIEGVGHTPWLMCGDQITIVRDFLLSPDDLA
jgi:hypothetical protein